MERTREQHTLDLHMGVPWETVTLTAFGRDKNIYFHILEEGNAKTIFNGYYESQVSDDCFVS